MTNEYETTRPENAGVATNDEVISTINNLIETCKDGQEGFQQAAEGVESSQLKSLFYELGQHRATFAGELQGLVRQLGGDPETTSSTVGALHRGWINIKSVITGKDDLAILNECERGEDSAKANYKAAVEAKLPSDVMSVISQQYSQVTAAHDKIRDLRDAMASAKSSAHSGS